LTDWAGRAIRHDKSGAIPSQLAPILERLNINPEAWLDTVKNYNKNYYNIVGTREAIKEYSAALDRKWFCLTRSSSQLYRAFTT
ncbi:MAG: transposase, partial [Candidatus Thiodiazotropha sp.]